MSVSHVESSGSAYLKVMLLNLLIFSFDVNACGWKYLFCVVAASKSSCIQAVSNSIYGSIFVIIHDHSKARTCYTYQQSGIYVIYYM